MNARQICVLLMSVVVMALFSCSPTPNNKVQSEETEHVGWYAGKEQFQTYYWIETSLSQGFYYGFKTGYIWQLAVGVVLFGAGIFYIYRKASDREKSEAYSKSFISWIVIVALLWAGFFFMHSKPANIAMEKYRITKECYDYHNGDMAPIIDSLWKANELRSAPAPKN